MNPFHNRSLLTAGVVALAGVVLLPFVDKAFTIDDAVFLQQSQHILRDPLHPTAFDIVFHGNRIRMSNYHVTGPVMGYVLVPTVLLGGSETFAHLMQLAFLIAGIAATASLAIRLGLEPTQAGLAASLIVVSPAVLGMTATGMPDVLAMTLGVMAIERLTVWKQSRHWHAGLMGGLLLALGALTRPQLVLLLPLAGFWVIERGEGNSGNHRPALGDQARTLVPLALALMVLATVNYATRDPQSGGDMAGTIVSSSATSGVWWNLSSFLLHWAVAFPLTILWAALRGARLTRSPFAWTGIALGVLVALKGGYLALVGFMGATGAVLGDVLGDAWRRKDGTQAFLGLWLLLAAPAALYGHLPAKFLVPSAPAMALLIARMELSRLRRYRPFITTIAALGLILGVLIIRADAALAEIGREGGKVVAEQVLRGNRVWIDGVWGSQWYGIKAGAKPLASAPPAPAAGDVVVTGLWPSVLDKRYALRTLLYRRVYDDPGGRVLSEGAGFFSNRAGPLPWVWGTEELGRIEAWRIEAIPTPVR